MTINRIVALTSNDPAGMQKDTITDAEALRLHLNQLTSAGQCRGSISNRRGAILRLARFLDPYGDPRAVIEATSDALAEWQASKADLSAGTVKNEVGHIRLFYSWLVRPMRIIPESPADDLLSPIVRRRKPRPIPEDDYEYALNSCTDPRVYAWLILGGYAGLRSVDVAGLNRDDVLLDGKVPYLRVRGKGDHEDLIAVGHQVIDALTPFMRRRGPLFITPDGVRKKVRSIREEVNDYLKRLGLPYTFHQTRHRYGTYIYEISRDIRFAQKQMRHQTVTSTELYVAVPTDQEVRVVRALDQDLTKRTAARRRRRHLSA